MVRTLPPTSTDPFALLTAGQGATLAPLRALGLLPVYDSGDSCLVLREDLAAATALRADAAYVEHLFTVDETASALAFPARVHIDARTWLDVIPHRDVDAALGPAVARLQRVAGGDRVPQRSVRYLEPCMLASADATVLSEAATQLDRARRVGSLRSADLANTAYYMGSKRSLAPFLVEAAADAIDENGTVIDLMCGSGAASGAFAQQWPTIASDAQQFSRMLARAQGAGLTRDRAELMLEHVNSIARRNLDDLLVPLAEYVNEEEQALHRGDLDEAVEAQRQIIRTFPTLARPGVDSSWNPSAEVAQRRAGEPGPACLFTCYYANLFFGIRQAMEIDSLRCAISSLDPDAQPWALAALIASASAVAVNYGGHFAQPLLRDADRLTVANAGRVTELRALSVTHEFAARLRSLAGESELAAFEVDVVDGPWEKALTQAIQRVGRRPALVYFDPPYRRDEYSRYYHVLETLVRYDYPETSGPAQIPRKGAERFSSPFFTRSIERRHALLVSILERVIDAGWTCAWSYSTAAEGSIPEVLRRLAASRSCTLRSFVAKHRHRGQGSGRDRIVEERLILAAPR